MFLQIKSESQIRLYIIIICIIFLTGILFYLFNESFRKLSNNYIRRNITFIVVLFSFYIIYIITRLLFPKTIFQTLFDEDGVFEYLTTFFFLFASVFFILSLSRKKIFFINTYIFILASACFFVGMEEISWGQRIFGVETTESLKEINYQEELTVHNLVAPDYHPQIYLVISILCLIFFSFTNNKKFESLFWIHKDYLPSRRFITIAVFLPFISWYNMEHFEVILSFLFAVYAFQLYMKKISREGRFIWC